MHQKLMAAGRSRASPGPPDSPTHRSDPGGAWTLPAAHLSTLQHSPAHKQMLQNPPGNSPAGNTAFGGNATAAASGLLASSAAFSNSLGGTANSNSSVAAAAVAAAQEATAVARPVEDRLVLAEGRSMAAERAALEAARAADAAGQRVAMLSTQLAAAAAQVQEERDQREAALAMNQQVCSATPLICKLHVLDMASHTGHFLCYNHRHESTRHLAVSLL